MKKEYVVYFENGNSVVMNAKSSLEIMVMLTNNGTINNLLKIERR